MALDSGKHGRGGRLSAPRVRLVVNCTRVRFSLETFSDLGRGREKAAIEVSQSESFAGRERSRPGGARGGVFVGLGHGTYTGRGEKGRREGCPSVRHAASLRHQRILANRVLEQVEWKDGSLVGIKKYILYVL